MSQTPRHIFLTGYRGSGKTSVAKLLAANLNLPAIDLDDCIEATAAMSIREIFAREMESGFRAREARELSLACDGPTSVIALGGGAILRPRNRELIAACGCCVWLQVDVETVLDRLQCDETTGARRPALSTLPPREEIQTMLETRAPLYASVADFNITVVGKSVAEVAAEIMPQLYKYMPTNPPDESVSD